MDLNAAEKEPTQRGLASQDGEGMESMVSNPQGDGKGTKSKQGGGIGPEQWVVFTKEERRKGGMEGGAGRKKGRAGAKAGPRSIC